MCLIRSLGGTEQSSVYAAVEAGQIRSSSAECEGISLRLAKSLTKYRATVPVLSAQQSSLLVAQALKKTWSITIRLIDL